MVCDVPLRTCLPAHTDGAADSLADGFTDGFIRLTASGYNHEFGSAIVGSTQAWSTYVTNQGTVTAPSLSWRLTNTVDFYVSSTTCKTPIAPGTRCMITVRFNPHAAGSFSTVVTFTVDGQDSLIVRCAGTGTTPT